MDKGGCLPSVLYFKQIAMYEGNDKLARLLVQKLPGGSRGPLGGRFNLYGAIVTAIVLVHGAAGGSLHLLRWVMRTALHDHCFLMAFLSLAEETDRFELLLAVVHVHGPPHR